MVSAIAAVDNNYGIGYKNELLCHIKEDLKYFKRLTTKNVVVMGRKTWDSLPKKPLPNRINIVITNSVKSKTLIDGAIFITLSIFKNLLKDIRMEYNIFIIGGAQIYKELLPYCDYAYITRIYKSFENVDTYFPKLNKSWTVLDKKPIETQNDIEYQFCIYKNLSTIQGV